ncbi:hypothetical protein DICPUDRAFT_74952 [Dictyostelium purpureum]|uniref:Uncharacterized protein n=1 Tax=Dictyostelium purpureum TaxID=5786 RepID=F0Z978_DICPU|nr:uncharacterized protein DICPUDRAFT_74952 [Dictyostelium purpureum]EGC39533.1 hypothetical protein DICPUDRAFT_74952 [Dictyostelium purpureum]|eukprot:XP_003283980.1 hypothetical protein DICPUDRAFT_74952 [Dictyostelium purpureum]
MKTKDFPHNNFNTIEDILLSSISIIQKSVKDIIERDNKLSTYEKNGNNINLRLYYPNHQISDEHIIHFSKYTDIEKISFDKKKKKTLFISLSKENLHNLLNERDTTNKMNKFITHCDDYHMVIGNFYVLKICAYVAALVIVEKYILFFIIFFYNKINQLINEHILGVSTDKEIDSNITIIKKDCVDFNDPDDDYKETISDNESNNSTNTLDNEEISETSS